jgi:hypothetical protein
MAEGERLKTTASEEERKRQERFIARLRESSLTADFDEDSFDRELSGALRLFIEQAPPEAGLIRASDYRAAIESSSTAVSALRSEAALLRLISGVGLIRGHARYLKIRDRE